LLKGEGDTRSRRNVAPGKKGKTPLILNQAENQTSAKTKGGKRNRGAFQAGDKKRIPEETRGCSIPPLLQGGRGVGCSLEKEKHFEIQAGGGWPWQKFLDFIRGADQGGLG